METVEQKDRGTDSQCTHLCTTLTTTEPEGTNSIHFSGFLSTDQHNSDPTWMYMAKVQTQKSKVMRLKKDS